MQITKITSINNKKNDNLNFTALHVLHLPEPYASKSPEIIHTAVREYSKEHYPLISILKKFTSFIEKNVQNEIHWGDSAKLKDGKTAYVRFTEADDLCGLSFAPNPEQIMTAKTGEASSFHYVIDKNGEIKKVSV